VGFLLLAATWRVVPRLLRIFGPALQSPDNMGFGGPRHARQHAGIVSLLFALAHHTYADDEGLGVILGLIAAQYTSQI
jgi:hypothetical protein